jgi:hypothetical protein
MTVSKLTGGFWVIDCGIKVFEDVHSKERQQLLDKKLWGCLLAIRRIWRRQDVFVSPTFSALFLQVIFRESYIATCTVGHWTWWSRWPAYSSRRSPSLNCHLCVRCHTSVSKNIYFYLVKQIVLDHPSHFNTAFMGKSVATYVILNKVVGLGTAYEVTSRNECIYMFHGLSVSIPVVVRSKAWVFGRSLTTSRIVVSNPA